MLGRILLTVAALLVPAAVQPTLAQCVEDLRPVAVGEGSVEIKTYACRSGGVRVRAEFHRLSATATGVLMSGGNSQVLSATIGRPRLFRNDVAAVVDDILNRFGSTLETQYLSPYAFVAVPRGGSAWTADATAGTDLRYLTTDMREIDGFYYPASNELRALSGGAIPANMNRSGNMLWRFMTRADLTEYSSRLAEFNQLYANGAYQVGQGNDPAIDLMAYLSRDGMPTELSVIVGWPSEGGCATGVGWVFEYFPRIPIVDGIVVENLSSSSATLSSLTGSSSGGGLRALGGVPSGSQPILDVGMQLQPGERLFVPTRIVMAPSDELRPYSSTSYVYGPAYDVTGLVVDGQRISFDERSANFTEITLLAESGSCPYLMSWRGEDETWVDRGKVLHTANSADKEYTEIVEYAGLRLRFRLEEREPETAFIDAAKLVVELDDGSSRELSPDEPKLASVDGERLVFRWGDVVEFAFALPEDVAPSRVLRSTLRMTGYYERYAHPPVAIEGLGPVPASLDIDAPAEPQAELCEPARWQSAASASSFLDLSLD